MGADMKTMQASPLPGARGSAGGRKLLERLRVSEWKESSEGQWRGGCSRTGCSCCNLECSRSS